MRRLIVSIILLTALSATAQIEVKPYAHAQYRLRMRYHILSPDEGDNVTTNEYRNQIAYHAGIRASVSESMSFQFQVGNDWIATEDVDWEANEAWLKRQGLYPYFHLAFFNWNPGLFYLMGGIVPVQSHGPLDLLERSLNADTYGGAALLGWAVGTNASSMGIKVGAPIVNNTLKLGFDLFSTIITNRTPALSEDSPDQPNAVMFVLDIPLNVAKFSLTPQASVIFNRLHNANTEESDHEYAGGFSARYAFSDKFQLSAKFGYAQLSNENSGAATVIIDEYEFIDTTTNRVAVGRDTLIADETALDKAALIAGLRGSVEAGPGSFIFELAYSSNDNQDLDDAMTHYLFGDFNYGWKLNPYMTLMPRVRVFTTLFGESDEQNEMKTEIRPEFQFIAHF
ncbi:MAG: hypothetical protein ACOC41_00075 [Chitinivibrionales bacterium]